ncbi:protein phosphatase 1 regulatory subunit 36 isoform X3 [Ochotona princeps]|uniref:protein phosphatase 1 regulatory subunit 36 isoform X3 n=1 Tax=Ochotona princeps TaxID=9978 RepID=UPI0027154D2A|nr:protein phosphatase 1 regulatory subunit 36 isoform X3 [Ochotona princeps]
MYSVPELYPRRKRLDGQASPLLDHLGLRLGMWYWKDETRTLEFRSFLPTMEFKEKGRKGKAVHFPEMDGAAAERSKSLDSFLMALLYYLAYFLEKNSLERKPKSYMVGLVEKKELELAVSKLEAAQKHLAQKYCVLVLGLGMPDKHHMSCGKEKISDTQKDWKFFECFYTFCTYVAWVVFRRQHLTEIEEEVGRLFRTSMFNIPRRKREEEESGGERKRMTFVQFRRMMAKRPAIKKAINMRSPVLSTLLPSHREKVQNIIEKKYQAGVKLPAQEHLDFVPLPKVGILGEPRYLFNPHTLLPIDLEESVKSGRHSSVIERNNVRIQNTLDLVMKTLSASYPAYSR